MICRLAVSFSILVTASTAQQQWTLSTPTQQPSPRLGAAMAYSAVADRTLLFGGQAQPSGWPIPFFADTWIHDGVTWSSVATSVQPPARSRHGLVALPSGTVVLFGGVDANGTPLNDLWTWNGTTWTPQPSSIPIAPRSSPAMTAVGSGVMVFGGYNDFTGSYLADTWSWFPFSGWSQLATFGAPSPRRGARMVQEGSSISLTMLLHGGFDGAERADTWRLANSTWTVLPAVGGPARSSFAMVHDAASGQTFLAGGRAPNGPTDDLWRFDGTRWRDITPATHPAPCFDAAFALDTTRHRLLTFGGDLGGSASAQTWICSSTYPVERFGTGCAASGPVPGLGISAAAVGGILSGAVNGGGGSVPVALVAFGFDDAAWSGVPLPLSLAALGLGCSLLVEPLTIQVHVGGAGVGGVGFYLLIPDQPALAGIELFVQGGILDANGLRGVTEAARCVLF